MRRCGKGGDVGVPLERMGSGAGADGRGAVVSLCERADREAQDPGAVAAQRMSGRLRHALDARLRGEHSELEGLSPASYRLAWLRRWEHVARDWLQRVAQRKRWLDGTGTAWRPRPAAATAAATYIGMSPEQVLATKTLRCWL